MANTIPENVLALLDNPDTRQAIRIAIERLEVKAFLQGIIDSIEDNCQETNFESATGLHTLFTSWINSPPPVPMPMTVCHPNGVYTINIEGASLPPGMVCSVMLMHETLRRFHANEPITAQVLELLRGGPLAPPGQQLL
jgi:hypothetical protein